MVRGAGCDPDWTGEVRREEPKFGTPHRPDRLGKIVLQGEHQGEKGGGGV